MSVEVVGNMRRRAAYCRRLASGISDERTARVLRDMADEIEADAKKLELEMRS